MRLLGSVIAFFLLAAPASVQAQSVNLADLVGTWEGGKEGDTSKHTLVFRPDSTSNWGSWNLSDSVKKERGEFRRWHSLRGDTISFGGGAGFKVVLKDQQLTLAGLSFTKLGDGRNVYTLDDHRKFVFKRVNAPTSKP